LVAVVVRPVALLLAALHLQPEGPVAAVAILTTTQETTLVRQVPPIRVLLAVTVRRATPTSPVVVVVAQVVSVAAPRITTVELVVSVFHRQSPDQQWVEAAVAAVVFISLRRVLLALRLAVVAPAASMPHSGLGMTALPAPLTLVVAVVVVAALLRLFPVVVAQVVPVLSFCVIRSSTQSRSERVLPAQQLLSVTTR